MRKLRAEENALLRKHKAQRQKERRAFKIQNKAMKEKHRAIIDELLEKSLIERHKLRSGIKQRMDDISKRQAATTEEVRQSIENDMKTMREALNAEDRRLADTKATSFIDAQNLISAQVFHEVRNA